MSKIQTKELLTIVRDSFEEQKNIKILSLYIEEDKIHGIYLLPLEQSLSFQEEPLLDMVTDIDGRTIIMEELGQLLLYAYNFGSIFHFFKIIHASDIIINNKKYDELIDICAEHPPLQRIDTQVISWLDNVNDISQTKIDSFIQICSLYNQLDDIDADYSITSTNDSSYIIKQFNKVIQQIQNKKHNKISEFIIHQINKLYIDMQVDLYMTDNK